MIDDAIRGGALRAGVAKADITCTDRGTWEALLPDKVKKHIPPDYLRKSVEVSDPCYVRALVIDDGRKKLVLVTMDVTAIAARTISQNILTDSADDFMPRLRQRVEDELGIPGGHVNVCASHTHQTPRKLRSDADQISLTVGAIRQAMRDMEPVCIGVGSGIERGLTFNRTLMMRDGSDYTIRSYYAPVPPDDQVEGLRPFDPRIGILKINREDGRPLALVYNFGCHLLLGAPDGTTGTITADHVGVTLRHLEERIGGGVMAFALQGSLGDVVEACQFDTGHPTTSGAFGVSLGQSILTAYRDIEARPVATVDVVSRRIALPLRTDIPAILAGLRQAEAEMIASLRYTSLNFKAFLPLYLNHTLHPEYPSHWAYRYMQAANAGDIGFKAMDERNRSAVEKYLASIRTMERLADNQERIATLEKHQEIIEAIGGPTVAAEFQGVRVGDCVFITAPMEVLSETGLKIKEKSPFQHTYVVSLSNGYLHYAPPASYYPRGGYEVTECLLAPEWEIAFDAVIQDLFADLQAGCGNV